MLSSSVFISLSKLLVRQKMPIQCFTLLSDAQCESLSDRATPDLFEQWSLSFRCKSWLNLSEGCRMIISHRIVVYGIQL